MLNIQCIFIGKTKEQEIILGIEKYKKRLNKYCKFEIIELNDVKSIQDISKLKIAESEILQKFLLEKAFHIFLDEIGIEFTSPQFAKYLEKMSSTGTTNINFYIGGAFGFSDEIRKKANYTLALSKMTFSHQMIRYFLIEQIYRAFTIIKGEKYHH